MSIAFAARLITRYARIGVLLLGLLGFIAPQGAIAGAAMPITPVAGCTAVPLFGAGKDFYYLSQGKYYVIVTQQSAGFVANAVLHSGKTTVEDIGRYADVYECSNSSSANAMADAVADYLSAKGFQVGVVYTHGGARTVPPVVKTAPTPATPAPTHN